MLVRQIEIQYLFSSLGKEREYVGLPHFSVSGPTLFHRCLTMVSSIVIS